MKRTPELLAAARQMHAKGATYKEIAEGTGLAAMTVYAWLNPEFASQHNERRKKRLTKGSQKYFQNLLCNARRDAEKGGFTPPQISPEQAARLWQTQANICAISGEQFENTNNDKAVLDHDHESGKARGFIRQRFNRGLGFFLHSPQLLRLAAGYLEMSQLEAEFSRQQCT